MNILTHSLKGVVVLQDLFTTSVSWHNYWYLTGEKNVGFNEAVQRIQSVLSRIQMEMEEEEMDVQTEEMFQKRHTSNTLYVVWNLECFPRFFPEESANVEHLKAVCEVSNESLKLKYFFSASLRWWLLSTHVQMKSNYLIVSWGPSTSNTSQVIFHFSRGNANVCFIQLCMCNSSSTCLSLLAAAVRKTNKDALLSQDILILELSKQNISTSKALWIFMRVVPWTVIIITPCFSLQMLLQLHKSQICSISSLICQLFFAQQQLWHWCCLVKIQKILNIFFCWCVSLSIYLFIILR